MRGKLARKLRTLFDERIRQELPRFVLVEDAIKNEQIPRGDRLYEWKMRGLFCGYLELAIFPCWDRFRIEVAWSARGSFPSHIPAMMHPVDVPAREIVKSEPIDASFRFSLAEFWKPREDLGWKVSDGPDVTDSIFIDPFEQMEQKVTGDYVEECVTDAIRRIKEYAIPYLERVAREYTDESQDLRKRT